MNNNNYFKTQLKAIINQYGDSLFLDSKKFYSIVSDNVKECEVEKKMFKKIMSTDLLSYIYKNKHNINNIEGKTRDIARIELLDFNQLSSFVDDLLYALGIERKVKTNTSNTNQTSVQTSNNTSTSSNKVTSNQTSQNVTSNNTTSTTSNPNTPTQTSTAPLTGEDLYNLGEESYKNRKYEDAYKYYVQSMNEGYLKGKLKVGVMLINGYGVPQDIEKGFKIIYETAKAGLVEGYIELGNCYHYGLGVKVDFRKANHWYKKAAKAGSAEGNFQMGISYSRGFGVHRLNYRKAKRYFRIAADLGHPDALKELNELYNYSEEIDD